MGGEIDMTDDYSLLLFVDVKDILNQKIKLDNTNSYDSIDTKKKQVCNNIINNSRVLYSNIINNKIEEEIDNRVPSLEDIECNVNNENERITFKAITTRKTITDYSKYVISKCGELRYANLELGDILDNITRDYFEKQQTTTKTINFNGRKPRTYVLKRLEMMALMIDSNKSVIFTANELNRIILDVLGNPDQRTITTYYECLVDYAKQNGGIGGMFVIRFNMRGFLETVRSLQGTKIC